MLDMGFEPQVKELISFLPYQRRGLRIYLSIYLSTYLSIYLSLSLSLYIYIYICMHIITHISPHEMAYPPGCFTAVLPGWGGQAPPNGQKVGCPLLAICANTSRQFWGKPICTTTLRWTIYSVLLDCRTWHACCDVTWSAILWHQPQAWCTWHVFSYANDVTHVYDQWHIMA